MAVAPLPYDPVVGHPRRHQILSVMVLCLVLVVAGVSSLNIAIPGITRALEPSQTQQLWIVDGYGLVFAGLLLPAGALGDRYGRKGALLVGLGLFAAFAVGASFATTPAQLIVTRAAMGIGAALIMPATLSILIDVFPAHERARAIAVWAGFAGAGGALGILAGGTLLEFFWWGSVFFVNVPLAILAFTLIAWLVPTSRDPDATPLDPPGALLSILGLTALVYALIDAGDAGWLRPATFAWFATAAALLALFVTVESRRPHPMLDPRWFRIPSFSVGAGTITAAFAVMFGLFFVITQFFQLVEGHSALGAGLRQLPFALVMVAVAPRGPALVERFGARFVIAGGLAVQAAGFAVLTTLDAGSSYLHVLAGLVPASAGMALLMPAATEAIVSSLPAAKAGVGSAVNDTTREVGGALGIALLGTLMATGYRNGMTDATAALPPAAADAARDSIGAALGVAG
ncbi:MAG: MFS transporter, partial [Actinomyces sp.]